MTDRFYRERQPSVELTVVIQDGGATIPATILIDGATALCGLTATAMKAVSSQHPHLGGKPIVALRYDVWAQTRATA